LNSSGLAISEVRRVWAQRSHIRDETSLKRLNLNAQPVTVDCNALTLTDRDQRLVLYSAPPGSVTPGLSPS
jgi:hypothetical protein